MKKTKTTPKPPAKPTVKSLSNELNQVRADLGALQQRLVERDAEVTGLKATIAENEAANADMRHNLQTAKRALKPFKDKTAKWNWPDDSLHIISPLTFGDVKAARDAAVAIGVEK